ncbi:MAG: NADP-dependent oxidoreductase [Leptospiraceae bacterium]|nr:NADP-dependent oxidoreductase [Leptospiraceae bacterium]
MKAIIINKYGEIPFLTSDYPKPNSPASDEVLINMKAGSINPIDWKTAEGKVKILIKYSFPILMGNDGSGVVESIGSDVKDFKAGDEVYFRIGKPKIGTFAEQILVKAKDVCVKPKNISFEEAAVIPLAGLTSYQALLKGNVTNGSKVLIHAGSGGVGTLAIQIAKGMGAYVATTCGTSNVELVKSLGADQVIDYRKENFVDVLKDFDFVFDTIGGNITFESFKVLKKGGIVVNISGVPTPDYAKKFGKNIFIQFLFSMMNKKILGTAKKLGVNYEYLFMESSGAQLAILKKLIEEGKLKPINDKVYTMEEAGQAFEHQMSGRSKGKVIIKIG